MYQGSRDSKVYPHIIIPKRDPFLIAGWENSPTREKRGQVRVSRAKFRTTTSNKVTLNQTIVSERGNDWRRVRAKSVEVREGRLLMATNFKYGSVRGER
jgi:hypothetical protein